MTRANTPAHFLSHLRQDSHLSRLLVNVQKATQEQDALAALLPEALRDQVLIRREQDNLWVLARNNAVAQLVRFQGSRLLTASGCARLHLRVGDIGSSDSALDAGTHTEIPRMSAEAGQVLLNAAESFDDPVLADALRQLAGNATSDS